MTPAKPTLIVLPPSHYCERARWALDHQGIDYQEQRWAVGLHVPVARRIAPRTALPILQAGSEIVQGSGHILTWAKIGGRSPALEERFERRIGVLLRQFIYSITLYEKNSAIPEMLFKDVSAAQARLGRLVWPITRRLMIVGMNTRPSLVPELEQRLASELDWFDQELKGKTYLVDDAFGGADITAASLLAPLVRPTAHPIYTQRPFPPRLEKALQAWTDRPSFRWVRNMYADHRKPDGKPGSNGGVFLMPGASVPLDERNGGRGTPASG